jgi:N-acetyl sugar amidotransferase|tara:strand:+ start:2334 stop:3347 length:1014 start_codon:yes stop_codon:yes gene_type:complete
MEEKKTLNWADRENQLRELLNRHRGNSHYDCIVTVSGGKDGSYVAHTLKNRYGINPLCLTIRPPMPMKIGDENLLSFINSGYEHIHVSTNREAMRKLDKIGFLEYGQGYFGWLISIDTAVMRFASTYGINLIFKAEDGEIEYGGSTEKKNTALYDIEYIKRAYLSEAHDHVLDLSGLSKQDRYPFEFPTDQIDSIKDIELTHLSYYENWDPYRNYLIAKEHCGLKELDEGSSGTFTNFAQNDQELASLHYYLMYLKFGFGRATQDAGIEIRRGAMSREQAVNLVSLYDNQPPINSYQKYADYYEISLSEFHETLDKFANKDLFRKVGDSWEPLFTVE